GMEHVIGGGLDDTFNSVDKFGGAPLRSIRGGDGIDTVTVNDHLIIDFTNDSEDIFQGVFEAEVVKSLNGGSLTVRSADGVEVDWRIFNFDNATENNNKGEITYLDRDPLKFANFFNLNGGDGNDAIRFSGNSRITGTVDGDKGVNHIDVSDASNTGSYSIELGTTRNDVTLNLLNIDRVIGNTAAPTELIVTEGRNTWTVGRFDNEDSTPAVEGSDFGNVTSNTISSRVVEFINVANLTGCSVEDHFDYSKGVSGLTGRIDGGGGIDQITGRNIASTWRLGDSNSNITDTAAAESYLNSFINIEILQGGDARDIFLIDTNFNGDLKGGSGNDHFNFGIAGWAKSVDGEAGDADRVTGRDASNIWNIASGNIVSNNNTYLERFTNINELYGGSQEDRFEINAQFDGVINGADGNDY